VALKPRDEGAPRLLASRRSRGGHGSAAAGRGRAAGWRRTLLQGGGAALRRRALIEPAHLPIRAFKAGEQRQHPLQQIPWERAGVQRNAKRSMAKDACCMRPQLRGTA
jgi:hypothetical protein